MFHKHEIETRLRIRPAGDFEPGNYGPGITAFTVVAYAIAEVMCKTCGQQLDRRSIEVRPEDLGKPLRSEKEDEHEVGNALAKF